MNDNLQPSDHLDQGNIVGTALEAVVDLRKTWGDARLGLFLSLGYFSGMTYTTEELAAMCDVSTETVRRWLKPLINIDRVRVVREGRSVRYKARAEWAMRTRDNLYAAHDRIERERQGSTNDNNLASLVTVRRMLTRAERELSTNRHR
jgi:hypothetical protein